MTRYAFRMRWERRNMTKLRRAISLCLCVCICLGVICSVLLSAGVNITFALDYRSELWFVDGINYALKNGERIALSKTDDASPYQTEDGEMYVPVSIICDYMGASYVKNGTDVRITLSSGKVAELTVGRQSWKLDLAPMTDFDTPVGEKCGIPYVTASMANKIFGAYSYYDKSMGLLILSRSSVSGYNSTYSSIRAQVATACAMIMDRPTGEQVYEDLEAYSGSTTHPRLLITEERFDELRDVYATDARGEKFYDGISLQVKEGATVFKSYFTVNDDGEVEWISGYARESVRQPYYLYDENGNRLVGISTYTYRDKATGENVTISLDSGLSGDGYDYGGRSSVGTFTEKMKSMAFAYQITGEKKYADAFYLFALELDRWEHWGEGHFLNVADGSYAYAVGYDWVYHAFDSEPYKRELMASILFNKGLMKGYYSIKYDGKGRAIQNYCDFSISVRAGADGAWRTANRTNNWQTVCGGGMIVTALALIENDNYRNECLYVIENYVRTYEKCLPQFAPDGAYPESPSYWAYCVNTLMNTVIALENSCGTDYGYSDAIGLYESYYYIAGISDSDYRIWNYHNSSSAVIDAKYFYCAAKIYDDPALAAYRDKMIFDSGFQMSLMDIIFYDPELDTDGYSMQLDHNFKGIHTATFRSSLDSGAIYTGLHVGPVAHDHSDFDTGNFILRMGGVDWCSDPGTENYNIQGFWDSRENGQRFKLYCKSLEGHSSVIIHSSELVHGQRYTTLNTSYPVIDSFYSDENGGYAISDMTEQYGSTCESAYRGVLLTNSRRTVILQDEISFISPTSLTWVLNLAGGITISKDGKTITSDYWNVDKKTTLRVTMLTDDDSLRFRRLNTNETVLDNTVTKHNSGLALARDTQQRVVIEANNITSFNVAVVFEILLHKDEAVGYSRMPMSEWHTSDDAWLNEANSDIVYPGNEPTYKYKASHFARANQRLSEADGDLVAMGEILRETAVYFTDYDKNNETIKSLIKEYNKYKNRYNYEISKINAAFLEAMKAAVPSVELKD